MYMVRIEWDDDHSSPLIGPFAGRTAAEKWATDWRKEWRKLHPRMKHMHDMPKVTLKVIASPGQAMCWAANH